MTILYDWRGDFDNAAVDALHAEAFGHDPVPTDWRTRVHRHSLGWVCAREGGGQSGQGGSGGLVGFVNVAWDGGAHAFVLDTMVARNTRGSGVGTELVTTAARGARAAGCAWLHVDFEEHLRPFYLGACGFRPTDAGLIALT
ncbi:GNAT family N-acetyltransferase [Streptomyces yaizuensis]|uniref:GNAT family N-acetyltransferase n=1 Tax=Streptomyces yaizuensis TaxID=2989713 RepID=A0ABQ5PAE3_9ACTN|nr:GNAT family N-acetyltransferase [Streptomyces sp. YSPA8]GLF99536.1 GNAT family N-acetyltransferase [Streptomyces sp. YSPA8]